MRAASSTTTAAVVVFVALSSPAVVVRAQSAPALPWMNTSLSPEQRAELLIAQMMLEQKVQQLSNDVRPLLNPDNRPPGLRVRAHRPLHPGHSRARHPERAHDDKPIRRARR